MIIDSIEEGIDHLTASEILQSSTNDIPIISSTVNNNCSRTSIVPEVVSHSEPSEVQTDKALYIGESKERTIEDPDLTIIISNLTRTVTEGHVKEIASSFGKINGISMHTPGNYAVEYSTKEEAHTAHRHLTGGQIDGQIIRVQFHTPEIKADEQSKQKHMSQTPINEDTSSFVVRPRSNHHGNRSRSPKEKSSGCKRDSLSPTKKRRHSPMTTVSTFPSNSGPQRRPNSLSRRPSPNYRLPRKRYDVNKQRRSPTDLSMSPTFRHPISRRLRERSLSLDHSPPQGQKRQGRLKSPPFHPPHRGISKKQRVTSLSRSPKRTSSRSSSQRSSSWSSRSRSSHLNPTKRGTGPTRRLGRRSFSRSESFSGSSRSPSIHRKKC